MLLCSGLSVLSAEDLPAIHFAINYAVPHPVRCAMSESEYLQQERWGWTGVAGTADTWTALLIRYDATDTPASEISRCVDELSRSKPTQRYLKGFVDAVHRFGYKGRALQWRIDVGVKTVCFLGVPQ